MATAARGWTALRVYLEMIKFEHSIFALPFAFIGVLWAHRFGAGSGSIWPSAVTITWVVVAMISCRSAAMCYNRIADRDIDSLNPRTRTRAIPAGLLRLSQVNVFLLASCALFFWASARLNPLALALSPVALVVTLFYSTTKRFTWLCHLFLGLSLGIAPAAAWIAVSGTLHPAVLPLVGAVVGWVSGFDVLYSMQDAEFDREQGLHSIPESFGLVKALAISRVLHIGAVASLGWAGLAVGAGVLYYVGVACVAGLLLYEQSLVRSDDLSKINVAFFTLNGFVSIGLFAFVFADLVIRR